jgi:hypothetical protein
MTNRPDIRIVTNYPETEWNKAWNNLQHPVLIDSVKSTWYMVVHETVPTNERLAAKQVTTTDRCSRYARLHCLPHRLTDCQEEGYMGLDEIKHRAYPANEPQVHTSGLDFAANL